MPVDNTSKTSIYQRSQTALSHQQPQLACWAPRSRFQQPPHSRSQRRRDCSSSHRFHAASGGEILPCSWGARGGVLLPIRRYLPNAVVVPGQRRVSSSCSVMAEVDPEYPGTAVQRMHAAMDRARRLSTSELNGDWASVRQRILWAAGLRDITNARPGQGYTGHAFNDHNHCDATTMLMDQAHNENDGRVAGIHSRNPLGVGIRIASLAELGPGGTWSTCMQGCHTDPPCDVAHVQFQSRIAFKLVWCPPLFDDFVLVDDDGALLASGTPSGKLPAIHERQQNYALVKGSKYSREADMKGSSN